MSTPKEYLLTNGLGGYSFNTLSHEPLRKYHSLYTLSLTPPTQRMHLISDLTVDVICGEAHALLKAPIRFAQSGTAVHTYETLGVQIEREAGFCHGTNQLIVAYRFDSVKPFSIRLTPLFNFRDHHAIGDPEPSAYHAVFDPTDSVLTVTAHGHKVLLKLPGPFTPELNLTNETSYAIEAERGYDSLEKHLNLGHCLIPLPKGKSQIFVMIDTINTFGDPIKALRSERQRIEHLIALSGFRNPSYRRLVQAADQFIVQREKPHKKSVIAGYPWFTDWGRDTMIAMPGLTLCTNRFHEGFEMVEGFLQNCQHGLIPNHYVDADDIPRYNTADATLWLFNALYLYTLKTEHLDRVKPLLPALKGIIEAHIHGTQNGIFMENDGLLTISGQDGQLTWMDAKVDDWVPTPRLGKVVEINALWYNALKILSFYMDRFEPNNPERARYHGIAQRVYTSFNTLFPHPDGDHLYDCIVNGVPQDIPRPNMVFAISLPFPVLDSGLWKPMITYLGVHFKTPYGLLTLKRNDPDYHPYYAGPVLDRDGAYHRGTTWAWLLGPYLEAHFKCYHDREYLNDAMDQILVQLDMGLIGSIAEIFDAETPHLSKGCPAQAWSVAELLRIADLLENEH